MNRYPRGKLNVTDEGQTQLAVTVQDGTLAIRFPKPMAWVGFDYDTAKALGELILRRAEEIKQ